MQKSGVAVVGLSCRFPGADNCEQFWDNLINGVDSVKKIPETRWNASEKTPQSQWVGLVDDVDSLDCRLFKISPADAELMDPQQKMLLQTVWHCIEDSGIPLQELQSKRTAVYISYFTSDHRNILVRAETKPSAAAMLGNCDSCIANRISFIFNFTGESLSVNTACAGGLVVLSKAGDEKFLAEVREKGDYLRAKLLEIPEVDGVDGLGMMIGIRLKTKNAADVCKAAVDNGLLLLTAKTKLRLLPPLNITKEEIDKGIEILKKLLA